MDVTTLGECPYSSPRSAWVNEQARVPAEIIEALRDEATTPLRFELAGPRQNLFFDPARTRAAIVTCGGLCPGMNNVIRSLFLELFHRYGVRDVIGFRYGFHGLDHRRHIQPFILTPELVRDIHRDGGTILGTSRGPVEIASAVDGLISWGINLLFAVGGDGTQRGAHEIDKEARRRGYPLAVVGIPKTIDNDVAYVSHTFGYLTAVEEATRVLAGAHTEAESVQDGVAVVKLMGRLAGYIAAGATIASQDVNFTLIPEVPFALEGRRGLLAALERRVSARGHAVIVVAEGAGQDLLGIASEERDASGNVKLGDIGRFLRDRIEAHFRSVGSHVTLRYFDPSYSIRSRPANAEDSIVCDLFARNAVHAAMAGKTGLVIGRVHDLYVHVPIEILVSRTKRMDPEGSLWHAVLAATGQPERLLADDPAESTAGVAAPV